MAKNGLPGSRLVFPEENRDSFHFMIFQWFCWWAKPCTNWSPSQLKISRCRLHEEYHYHNHLLKPLCFSWNMGVPQILSILFSKEKKQALQICELVWALMHSPSPVPGRAQFGRWMAPSTRFSDHGSTDGCIETQILVGWNDGSEWKIHRWEWDHIILQLGYLKSKLQNMHNIFIYFWCWSLTFYLALSENWGKSKKCLRLFDSQTNRVKSFMAPNHQLWASGKTMSHPICSDLCLDCGWVRTNLVLHTGNHEHTMSWMITCHRGWKVIRENQLICAHSSTSRDKHRDQKRIDGIYKSQSTNGFLVLLVSNFGAFLSTKTGLNPPWPTLTTNQLNQPFVASLEADFDYEGPGQDVTQRRAATPKTERRKL